MFSNDFLGKKRPDPIKNFQINDQINTNISEPSEKPNNSQQNTYIDSNKSKEDSIPNNRINNIFPNSSKNIINSVENFIKFESPFKNYKKPAIPFCSNLNQMKNVNQYEYFSNNFDIKKFEDFYDCDNCNNYSYELNKIEMFFRDSPLYYKNENNINCDNDFYGKININKDNKMNNYLNYYNCNFNNKNNFNIKNSFLCNDKFKDIFNSNNLYDNGYNGYIGNKTPLNSNSAFKLLNDPLGEYNQPIKNYIGINYNNYNNNNYNSYNSYNYNSYNNSYTNNNNSYSSNSTRLLNYKNNNYININSSSTNSNMNSVSSLNPKLTYISNSPFVRTHDGIVYIKNQSSLKDITKANNTIFSSSIFTPFNPSKKSKKQKEKSQNNSNNSNNEPKLNTKKIKKLSKLTTFNTFNPSLNPYNANPSQLTVQSPIHLATHTSSNLEKIKQYIALSKNISNCNETLISNLITNKTTNGKPLIFLVQKIKNKTQYESNKSEEQLSNLLTDLKTCHPFQISLNKIKRIFLENCLILLNKFDKNGFTYNDDATIGEFDSITSCQISIIKRALNLIHEKKLKYFPKEILEHRSIESRKRNKYFMFSPEAKNFCLELHRKENVPLDFISKMCNVPSKSLKRWMVVGCIRKKGCGRKIRDPSMEKKLVDWYKQCVGENILPMAKMIRKKALEMSDNKEFLASKGWLEKFKKKYNVKSYSIREVRNAKNGEGEEDKEEKEGRDVKEEVKFVNINKEDSEEKNKKENINEHETKDVNLKQQKEEEDSSENINA